MKNFKIDKQTVFHRYLICPNKLQKNKKEGRRSQDLTVIGSEYGSSTGSTIHLCRSIQLEDPNIENWPLCIMKRVGFSYKDLKRGANSYAATSHIRKIQQIRTEFMVFNLMANSKRCIKLVELLTENTRRYEDQNFFYKYLGLKKIEGIENACLFLEYCNGGDLQKMIQKKESPFTQNQVVYFASQILEGLNELKKKGVLHRDLRPCNIFIHNGEVKFADFDSAYIFKLSSISDVSNGIDIDTTPPEIVELASKSEQELRNLGNQKIYLLQQKCDIYFFGMILFKMIFKKNYYKTYEGATLDYLLKQQINKGYSQQLLDVMKWCLHWSVEKRIDLKTLNTLFTEIQKKNYFDKKTQKQELFLSNDPLTLFEITEVEITKQQDQEDREKHDAINYFEMENQFKEGIVKSYRSRYSQIYKYKLQDHIGQDKKKRYSQQNLHVWQVNPKIEQNRSNFMINAEKFVKKLSMRGFFYDYLYKIILRIDLRALKNKEQKSIMKQNKAKMEKQLVIALMFIFQMLSRTPFKRDKYYEDNHLSYEVRRLFLNLVKINNKAMFFQSRTQILGSQESELFKVVQEFYSKQYTDEEQSDFEVINESCEKVIKSIELRIKDLLVQTCSDLIKSYQNKSNEKTNLRQILLVLIIFSQQKIEKFEKSSLVILKNVTEPLIYREKCLSEEVEVYFSEFKKQNYAADQKSQHKLNSHSKINSYKNFLPGIPSAKVTGQLDNQIDYNYSIKINGS